MKLSFPQELWWKLNDFDTPMMGKSRRSSPSGRARLEIGAVVTVVQP
jgi:hypothetical protein